MASLKLMHLKNNTQNESLILKTNNGFDLMVAVALKIGTQLGVIVPKPPDIVTSLTFQS